MPENRPTNRLTQLRTRLSRGALGFDAWMNDALFSGGRSFGEGYGRFAEKIQRRFRVTGVKRFVLDLASEGVTLGLAGGVVMLTLAQSAFNQTSENWLKAPDLAVTFLDRYGTEVGRRGIKHDDSLRIDEFPDILIKALISTEDRRFYEHWGIDPIGTLRAVTVNARGGGHVQGGSSLTQQLAKNLFCRTSARSSARSTRRSWPCGSNAT